MAEPSDLGDRESVCSTPSEHRAYHKAEQELQDHILDVYGSSGGNDDLFRPALADHAKIGFFSLDRACQTEVTEVVDLKEMTEVLQILLQDVANLRRDINFTKHVMQADHDSKLQEKSLELYCRINEKVVELEKMHQDRVNSLRKAFRQQLADAISRLAVHFSKNLQTKMVRERTKQKSDLASKEEKYREMQATILRNEGVIQMLKAQIQQQQMRQQEKEDERFMERRFTLDESSPRVDSALQEQLNTAQEDLDEAQRKLEKTEKKISRLEEALDIKDEEIMQLNKQMDTTKDELERRDIMIEQLRHEQGDILQSIERDKETQRKTIGNQREEMNRMMEEQIRLAREEVMAKMNEEVEKASNSEQAKVKQLKSQVADLEKQLVKAKEKSKSTTVTQESLSSKTINKDMEDRLRNDIIRLQAELEKVHRMWEKKFAILQQSMHALKDESYLRQTLQRQAATLHHAAVSYSADAPSGVLPTKAPASSPKKPLPEIRRGSKGQAQDKDFISYTVSAPSGRGTAMFSADENQIMSDNEIDMLPTDMAPLPAPPSRKGNDCGEDSRPSTQPHVVVLPSVEAK